MNELEKYFEELKDIKWENATVTFYIVKRILHKKKATYNTFLVETEEKLQEQLRSNICKKIESSENVLEYDFTTSDLDNNVLGMPTNETNFQKILETINSLNNPEKINDCNDLLDSYMYVARLDKDDNTLYSARKVSDGWSTKKAFNVMQYIWKDQMLCDINQKKIFRIDKKIDFFSYGNSIFIADKKQFETALNFREGMIKNRDAIVEEFKKRELFSDPERILELVGNNIPRLRKLSQVQKSGYYKDENFLQRLQSINESEGWDLEYSNKGKIEITEENIDSVLTVLNNSRLTSLVNKETFDTPVKQKFNP
jgi:hypothetical protein